LGSDLIPVGRVGRPHGLDGSFFVEGASEDEQRFARGTSLRVDGEPAKVVASKRSRGRPVIKLDRDAPRGAELAVPRDELPPPGEDEFYEFQLVGLEALEDGGRELGRVVAVHPGPANDALELDGGLLLPLVGACVLQVDLEAGRILVAQGFAPRSYPD
jgi:16S rRNA processing protein RimM